MTYSLFEDDMKPLTKTSGPLPPAGAVLRAGAFGAVLGTATGGLQAWQHAQAGELSREEAVEAAIGAGIKSAGTMAIAAVASHVVKRYPAVALSALALVGLGTAMVVVGNAAARKNAAPDQTGAKAKKTAPAKSRGATKAAPAKRPSRSATTSATTKAAKSKSTATKTAAARKRTDGTEGKEQQ